MTPSGYFTNLSTNCKETVVGFTSRKPNFLKIEKGIKLILVPRSHRALLNFKILNIARYSKTP